MLNVVIICVGKIDKEYWKLPFQEYYKRLQNTNNLKFVIHTINEINTNKNVIVNLKLEYDKINDYLSKYLDYQQFLLDINGQLISSEELATIVAKNKEVFQGKLLFIIGSSFGVLKELKENNRIKKISFGKITLLHQLAQVILLEQLYRALQIIARKPYHK